MFHTKNLDFEEMHLIERFHMDDKPHQFVFHDHWRGKGAHLDHRWVRESGGRILDGMTVAHMRPGIAKEDVTTVDRARTLAGQSELWKITKDPGPLRMFAESKAPEPYQWLGYQGIVKPGTVGATRKEWGVFHVRDKGVQFYGAQKPYFKEFFLKGSTYTGRWIYRLIERRKPEGTRSAFLWLFGKSKDQRPYVISRRAKKDGWVPPFGVSCLPPEIRTKIPVQYQYWKKQDAKQRIEVRDALYEAIKKGEVKLKYEGVQLESETKPYVVQWHLWKKRTVIREGPSAQHWDLVIEESSTKPLLHFLLNSNPLTTKVPIAGYTKKSPSRDWMTKEGYLKPGTPGNPTKDTPAWVRALTKGKVVIVQKSDMFCKLQFLSGGMKGLWIAKREAAKASMWTLSRSELPQPK